MRNKFLDIANLSLKYYFNTFYVSLGFGLIYITLLNVIKNVDFSIFFGNLTYSYITNVSLIYVIPTIVLGAFINSIFVTLLIFVIRKKLLQEHRKVYVIEYLKKHSIYVFLFNLLIYFLIFLIYIIFTNTRVSFFIPILTIIILVINFYTIQSIVIDEKNIFSGISYAVFFLKKNFLKTIILILVLTILYFLISLIAFYFSFGWIISMILYTLFFYPFLEIVKTIIYLTKYEIVKSYL